MLANTPWVTYSTSIVASCSPPKPELQYLTSSQVYSMALPPQSSSSIHQRTSRPSGGESYDPEQRWQANGYRQPGSFGQKRYGVIHDCWPHIELPCHPPSRTYRDVPSITIHLDLRFPPSSTHWAVMTRRSLGVRVDSHHDARHMMPAIGGAPPIAAFLNS